jgi:ribonuclease BN (tRNA processing enzyme)
MKYCRGPAANFDTARVVLLGSGTHENTAPCAPVTEACRECNVLVHEVYSTARFAHFPAGAKPYYASFHTSTRELPESVQSKFKWLVLSHQLDFGPRDQVDLEDLGGY